jgi:hypothetical protein
MRTTAKRLIPRCFDPEHLHNSVNFFRGATKIHGSPAKDLAGELFDPQ